MLDNCEFLLASFCYLWNYLRLTPLPEGKHGGWEYETNISYNSRESCVSFLAYVDISDNHGKSKREEGFLFIRSLDIFDSTPLLSVWIVTAACLFSTSAAFFSFTEETVMHFIYTSCRRCGLQASSAVSYGKTVGLVLYLQPEANLI